jgi:hypothetical protein
MVDPMKVNAMLNLIRKECRGSSRGCPSSNHTFNLESCRSKVSSFVEEGEGSRPDGGEKEHVLTNHKRMNHA